jgi:histidyl-tRNA synthetase
MALKAQTSPPKGCRDFLPQEVRRREYAIQIIRQVFEAYGFEPIQTPTFERLETLVGKYGDEGDQLLFKVLLRGQPLVEGIRRAGDYLREPKAIVHGRSGETAPGAEMLLADMGLRYDQTVPLARVYAAYRGKLPAVFKSFQIQPVWRADTPGKGRFREFYQCDMDVVGSSALLVEVELGAAASECLTRLGFASFELRINHRGLLCALIELAGISESRETDAIIAIDKLDKLGTSGVEAELEQKGIEKKAREKLLKLVAEEPSLERIRQRVDGHATGRQAVREIQTVLELSAVTPAAQRFTFDVRLARGLDYYTGCIFEAIAPDLGVSLGGGGRYDNLIGMFTNKQTPACGFSLGLERILVVMQERGLFPESLSHLDVVLAASHQDDRSAAVELASKLRRVGNRVELLPNAVQPGKLRKTADTRGVPIAIWLEQGAKDQASLWRKSDGSIESGLSFDRIIQLFDVRTKAQ